MSPFVYPSSGQSTLSRLVRSTFTSLMATSLPLRFLCSAVRPGGCDPAAASNGSFSVLSLLTSAGATSSRRPKKTGCRMSPSSVHSENLTSQTSFRGDPGHRHSCRGRRRKRRLFCRKALQASVERRELRVRKPAARVAYVDQRAVVVDTEDEGAEADPAAPGPGEAGDDRLLAQIRLDLQPLTAAMARPVRACAVLGDDPLDARLPGRVEEGLSFRLHVVAQQEVRPARQRPA